MTYGQLKTRGKKGGTHTWDNVRIACTKCNLLKRDSIPTIIE